MIAQTPGAPGGAAPDGATLGEEERGLHRALVDSLLATGNVPPPAVLAAITKIAVDELPARLRTLAEGDYLSFDAAGEVACLYPFSVVPTPHAVVIDGERRYAMCAIDALGVAAMLGRRVQVEASCAACGTPVRLGIRPGAIDAVEPSTAVVVARRNEDKPAVMFTCPFTVFACGQAHAAQLSATAPGARTLSVTEAHALGETLFADHLAPTLPAKRCRR